MSISLVLNLPFPDYVMGVHLFIGFSEHTYFFSSSVNYLLMSFVHFFCCLLFLKKIILFIYLFGGLHWGLVAAHILLSSNGKQGLLSSCSPWVSHYIGFSCAAQALGHRGSSSQALEHSLNSCGKVARQHVGSSGTRHGNRISSIAGRFFTTEPPGNPLLVFLILLLMGALHILYSDYWSVTYFAKFLCIPKRSLLHSSFVGLVYKPFLFGLQ